MTRSAATAMRADLKRSGLNGTDETTLRLEPLDASRTRALTRRFQVPSYKLPYFNLAGELTPFYRLRLLAEARDDKGKLVRYYQPKGSRPYLYLPPYLSWSDAALDHAQPLLLTEGEKKAATGCKLLELPVAGLGGCWNFASKKFGLELLPELAAFDLNGRQVKVAFDGDAVTNESVSIAEKHLAALLVPRGADVFYVRLPEGLKLDDFLVKYGPDDFHKLPCDAADPRSTVRRIRSQAKVPPHEKAERVANVVVGDLTQRGSLHRVDQEPLYFDRDERRLHSLLARDSGELAAFMGERYGLNPSEDMYRYVFEHVRGRALRHGAPATTPLFAHFDRARGALYVDVGANRVAQVTARGWKLVPNGTDDVLFRGCRLEPVEPARRGSERALEDLLGLPNFGKGQRLARAQQELIHKLHWWSYFFPMRTNPILVANAVKGSAKTTSQRAQGLTLFGAGFNVHTIDPKRLDDVTAALVASPLVVLDNLDGRVPGIENLLAVASTGGTVPRRLLYTTMELAEFRLRARVVATSRQPDVFVRDDLRDRAIILSLERLKQFRPEGDIIEATLAKRPAVWAHLLERLPAVVKALAKAKPEPVNHRLADFARFCLVAGPVLGYPRRDVEAALDSLEAERHAFAGTHSRLLQALDAWINFQRNASKSESPTLGCEKWTAGQIMQAVNDAWPYDGKPFHRPETFALALKNEEPTIRATYDVRREEGRSHNTLITIRPRKETSDV